MRNHTLDNITKRGVYSASTVVAGSLMILEGDSAKSHEQFGFLGFVPLAAKAGTSTDRGGDV